MPTLRRRITSAALVALFWAAACTPVASRRSEGSRALTVRILAPAVVQNRAPVWSAHFKLDRYDPFGAQLITHNTTTFYVQSAGRVAALSEEDGSTRWTWNAPAQLAAPILSRGNVIYATSWGGFLYALNARTGSLLWSRTTPNYRPQLRISGHALFMQDTGSPFHPDNGSSPCCGYAELDSHGRERWRAHVKFPALGTTLLDSTYVFELPASDSLAAAALPLMAFDRSRGKLAWEHPACALPFALLGSVVYCRSVTRRSSNAPFTALTLDRIDLASGASLGPYNYAPDPELHFQQVDSPLKRQAEIEGWYAYISLGGTIYRYDLRRLPKAQQPATLPRTFPSLRWAGGPHNGWLYVDDDAGLWAYKMREGEAIARLLMPNAGRTQRIRFDGNVAIAEIGTGQVAIFDARDPRSVVFARTACTSLEGAASTAKFVALVCLNHNSYLITAIPR